MKGTAPGQRGREGAWMIDHTLYTSEGFTQSCKDQLLVMLSSL